MDPETVDRLVDLNRRFYQSFALPFSETRRRLQPGVARLLERISAGERILDLGCGAGTLASALAQHGFSGSYLGLDFSLGLLEAARENVRRLETPDSGILFRQADLSNAAWAQDLPAGDYDAVLAFAVLHHIPSSEMRLRLLRQVREILTPGGLFYLSNWQFLNSPRLRGRIQAWGEAGIDPAEVEPEDYLLDWRREGRGLRYVHHFREDELFSLAEGAGFAVQETFCSDGSGGRLGLYQVWVPE
jgi:SAM-dependent methyltransferase